MITYVRMYFPFRHCNVHIHLERERGGGRDCKRIKREGEIKCIIIYCKTMAWQTCSKDPMSSTVLVKRLTTGLIIRDGLVNKNIPGY